MTLDQWNKSTLIEIFWIKQSKSYKESFAMSNTRALMFMIDRASMNKSTWKSPEDIFHLPLIDGKRIIKTIDEDTHKRAHLLHNKMKDLEFKKITV